MGDLIRRLRTSSSLAARHMADQLERVERD